MCFAIPGQILVIRDDPGGLRRAEVRFGARTREVCLACTPAARVGDWVISHAGYATEVLDADAAATILAELALLAGR